MTWDYCLLDRSFVWGSNMDTQLLEDLLTLNALLSITHTEGNGWDAYRNQSIEAIKRERLLALSELA